jgi:hypothetical protein
MQWTEHPRDADCVVNASCRGLNVERCYGFDIMKTGRSVDYWKNRRSGETGWQGEMQLSL